MKKRRNKEILKKWIFPCLILSSFFGIIPQEAKAEEVSLQNFSEQLDQTYQFPFQTGIVINQQTGQILYEKQADQLHGIASLTKLLSLYVIYDYLANDKLQLDSKVSISPEVAAHSRAEGLSNVPLQAGDDYYTVDQLLDAIIIASANSATVALAEKIAGSEDQFIQLMENKLKELHISDYQLVSASGLHSGLRMDGGKEGVSPKAENQLSARSIAVLVQHLLTDYPDVQRRAQITDKNFKVSDQIVYPLQNSNQLLPGMKYETKQVTGLKTGTEEKAGACLVATFRMNQQSIIAVTLGAPSDKERFLGTKKLLKSLENHLVWTRFAKEGSFYNEGHSVSVYGGNKVITRLQYQRDVACFLPKKHSEDVNVWSDFENSVQYNTEGQLEIKAPLVMDKKVADERLHLSFYENINGQKFLKAPLSPTEEVKAVSLGVQITRKVHETIQFIMSWFRYKIVYG